MRLKKALALTLTAAMAIGTLAGCGSSSGTAETTVKETTQAAATESTASAETESTATKSLADYDKVDTFNAYMMGAGITDEEFNNLEQAKLFEEKPDTRLTIHRFRTQIHRQRFRMHLC